MSEIDQRAQKLMDWLDEWWQVYPNERTLTTAATIQLHASGDELDWLAREWRARRGPEDATEASGAADVAKGSAPAGLGVDPGSTATPAGGAEGSVGQSADAGVTAAGAIGDPGQEVGLTAGVAVDPDTGEVYDEEEIPFEVAEGEEELAGDGDRGGDLVPAGELVSLFGRGGPDAALVTVEAYADAFKRFVKAHDLTLEMEDGADYVLSPGWEALGQMTGVFAEIEWTQGMPNGWKARAFAHRPATGERWTSREAVATRAEPGKKWKSDSELLSMAQTRACRNALRAALSVVVNAAGFDSAPPEERSHSPRQRAMLFAILARLEQARPKGKDGWKDWTTKGTLSRFGKRISGLNRQEMTVTIERVKQVLEELEGSSNGYDPSDEELREAEGIEFG